MVVPSLVVCPSQVLGKHPYWALRMIAKIFCILRAGKGFLREVTKGHNHQEVLPGKLVHPWRGSMACNQVSLILPGALCCVTLGRLLTSLSLRFHDEKWTWIRTHSVPCSICIHVSVLDLKLSPEPTKPRTSQR